MIKILLPTDFSENAWNATEYALNLFEQEPCTFYLVNTYTPAIVHSRFMATTVQGGMLEDNVRHQSENGLVNVVEQIKTKYPNPGHKFETISSFSLLTEQIREIVESEKIDLIISGTKGASGIDEVFMGSNTVRIIKSSKNCPVLTIPSNFKYRTPGQIGFTTNFKRSFSPRILAPLKQLADRFESAIQILHIQQREELDDFQKGNRDLLLDYFAPIRSTLQSLPYYASKSDVLQNYLEESNIDMLAMVHYRHGFLEELVREPVVKRVAFHTRIPLLVLPE
ncbi:MAG: universal stress protein [Eudoraea sp.]|nr:universal stress protein [Eudoraea sp.]NNJ40165.1 universal stress protein [Eudoraea sp.]